MTAFLRSQFQVGFVSERQFIAAISILTAVVCCLVFFLGHSLSFILFVQGAIFFNAVQHIVLFTVLHIYNPGLFSAVSIVLFCMYWFWCYRLCWEKNQVFIILAGSLFTYPIATWAALWIGSMLF